MKDEPTPPLGGKTPHDRFLELGKKLMAVTRTEVVEQEKKWQSSKQHRKKR
jgi:hypothetical protein